MKLSFTLLASCWPSGKTLNFTGPGNHFRSNEFV
jgi:hypothetical protein